MNLNTYLDINNSFEKTVKYRLTDRGFYSEVCCLLGAANYCMQKRLRLTIDDEGFSGFRWKDFYEDALPKAENFGAGDLNEITVRESHKYNRRLNRFRIPVWNRYERCFQSIFSSYAAFADILCRSRFTASFSSKPYLAVQLRRGDKVGGYLSNGVLKIESKLSPISKYTKILRKYEHISNDVFVLTDDFSAFRELQNAAPEFTFSTYCQPDEAGYDNNSFHQLNAQEKRGKLMRLIKSVEICGKSSFFIGPFQSNPSKFVVLTQGTRSRSVSTDSCRRWRP